MEIVCGIYCISNCVTNKKYIGKSKNIYKRKMEHFGYLRNNKHHSEHLQNSFNKYGANCFVFGLIEECDFNILDERERYYIDLYDTYNNGYNCALPTGVNCGRVFSDEDRNKQSIIMRRARARMSPEMRAKNLAGLAIGRKNAYDLVVVGLLLYDKNTLELKYKSKSIGDCADYLNIKRSRLDRVLEMLKHRRILTYKGYIIIRDNRKESLDLYLRKIEEHKLEVKMRSVLRSGLSIINNYKKEYNHKIKLINNTENRLAAWKKNSLLAHEAIRKSEKHAVDIYLFNTGEYIGRWNLLSDFAKEYNIRLGSLQKVMCGERRYCHNFVVKKVN